MLHPLDAVTRDHLDLMKPTWQVL